MKKIIVLVLLVISTNCMAFDKILELEVVNGNWNRVYEILNDDTSATDDPVKSYLLSISCLSIDCKRDVTLSELSDNTLMSLAFWLTIMKQEYPENNILKYIECDLMFNTGDFEESIQLASTITDDSDNYILLNLLNAILYSYKNMFDSVLNCYGKIISKYPEHSVAYLNRGAFYALIEQPEKAIIDYNKAEELNPAWAKIYYNRGNLYLKSELFSKAIDDYNKAIEINPEYFHAYLQRGRAFAITGQYENSISDLKYIISKANPKYSKLISDAKEILSKIEEIQSSNVKYEDKIKNDIINAYAALARLDGNSLASYLQESELKKIRSLMIKALLTVEEGNSQKYDAKGLSDSTDQYFLNLFLAFFGEPNSGLFYTAKVKEILSVKFYSADKASALINVEIFKDRTMEEELIFINTTTGWKMYLPPHLDSWYHSLEEGYYEHINQN
ncbi:MAG: tetratricopeptide repeat protein [bacterium]